MKRIVIVAVNNTQLIKQIDITDETAEEKAKIIEVILSKKYDDEVVILT